MKPSSKRRKVENIQEPSPKSILDLNDDCIIEIFSYFNPPDLVELDKVSPRFRHIANEYFYQKKKVLQVDVKCHSDEQVADLAERFGPHITTLEINGHYREFDDDAYLKPLWTKCTKIQHLKLDSTMNLTTIHLKHLKKIFKRLKSADIFFCEAKDNIGAFLNTASKLESLSLAGNDRIEGSFLPKLKHLKVLNLRGCIYLSGDYFQDFCKDNLNLESLAFTFYRYGDDLVAHIAELKNLKSLDMENVEEAPYTRVVPDFPHLTHLEIHGNPRETTFTKWNVFLKRLSDRDTLEYLSITASSRYVFSRILPKFTKLKVLEILTHNFFDSNLLRINMKSRETLEHLEIYGPELKYAPMISDTAMIQFIKDCPQMKKLDLTFCRRITNDLIIGLMDILNQRPHCTEIWIYGTSITRAIKEELQLREHQKIKLMWKWD